jgi:hypothetical protein
LVKRWRHVVTVGRLTFRVRATALFVAPGSAHAKIIRARSAKAERVNDYETGAGSI